MKLTITFKHLEHTPALDEMIRHKSEKLLKFFGGEMNVQWVCSVQKGDHVAEVVVNGAHVHYEGIAHSENLYKSVDLALEKIEKQLTKKKEKMKNHKDLKPLHDLETLAPEVAWTDHDEEVFDDVSGKKY